MRYTPGVEEWHWELKGASCRGKTLAATQFYNNRDSGRCRVRPNDSLSWRDAVRFYIAMVVANYGIAITLQDAWLILPLAGLERLVPGFALYVVARRNASWQATSISEDLVEVFEQRLSREHQCFQRACSIVVGGDACCG